MTRELIGTLLILFVVAIALNIYRKVRIRRTVQESELPEPAAALSGEPLFEGFYVATVFADQPLVRIWAYGLGGRGRVSVSLAEDGVVVERTGERGFLIPHSDIVSVKRAMATIDRAVEKAGLLQIQWRLGGQTLLTSFRVTQNQEEIYNQLKIATGVAGE